MKHSDNALGPLDLIERDRKTRPVKPLVFKTPGRECAHATRGCCPKCLPPFPGAMSSRLTDNIAGYTGSVKAAMHRASHG